MSRALATALALLLASTAAAQEEVLVQQGSTMRYLANSTDPGIALDWVDRDFDDSSWAEAIYGVGYETGSAADDLLDTVVPDTTLSVYTRAEFTVADPASVTNLLLSADWDDGYAAWINGVEVHRSDEMPGGDPDWDTAASLHESSNAAAPVYSPLIDITASAVPLLQPGRNVLAVGAWNANAGSSDLVLVPLLVRDRPPTVIRGPYLQLATPDSVFVRWRTSAPAASRLVHHPAGDPGASVVVEDLALKLDHELPLTGLTPESDWSYQIDGAGPVAFRTPPPDGECRPTRVWVIGDSGTGNSDARAVRDAYDTRHGVAETDVWLLLGDNAYDDGTDAEYQRAFFETYPDMAASVAAWPTLGNHDGRSADSADESGVYYDIFTLPRAAEAGGTPSGTEAYYSFDHANVHFVCLDSFESDSSPGGAMMTWLAADLVATEQDWVIAYWHHPPYTKGSHDSDDESELIDMREHAVPVLEAAGVDLVLTGHSHGYERSMLIDGHIGDSSTFGPGVIVDGGDGNPSGDGEYAKPTAGVASHEGAVYAVAGSSGKVDNAPYDHPAMVLSLAELGSMVLEIDGREMDAIFLDDAGNVLDSFRIVKGCTAAPCPDARCAVTDDADGDGVLDGQDCAPADAGAWALPGSPATLFVGPPAERLSWTDQAPAAGPDTAHDVLSGDLAELRADAGLDRASCLASGVAGDTGLHPTLPGLGRAWWYLVRATNVCGDSDLGSSSLGARTLPTDPCP